jgi:hypothetical protein
MRQEKEAVSGDGIPEIHTQFPPSIQQKPDQQGAGAGG